MDDQPMIMIVGVFYSVGQRTKVRTPALFVMIGASPHTEWLEGAVDRDRNGFILTGADLRGRSLRGSSRARRCASRRGLRCA